MHRQKINKECYIFPILSMVEFSTEDIVLSDSNLLIPDIKTTGVNEYETRINHK